jgi:hypothetical protein
MLPVNTYLNVTIKHLVATKPSVSTAFSHTGRRKTFSYPRPLRKYFRKKSNDQTEFTAFDKPGISKKPFTLMRMVNQEKAIDSSRIYSRHLHYQQTVIHCCFPFLYLKQNQVSQRMTGTQSNCKLHFQFKSVWIFNTACRLQLRRDIGGRMRPWSGSS